MAYTTLTMVDQSQMAYFDLHERLKDKSPPVVPYAVILCVQELLERFNSKEVQTNVHTLRSFFRNARMSLRSPKSRKIMEKLFRSLCSQPRTFVRLEMQRQKLECMGNYHCHVIFATMMDFFSRCKNGISVKLRFPSDGWIIFGPPPPDSGLEGWEKPDISFTKHTRIFISCITQEDPIRKDFFVYIMYFLTRLVELDVVDPRRLKNIYQLRQRRCLSTEFGKILLQTVCEFCCRPMDHENKSCEQCSEALRFLKRQPNNAALETLLQYVASETWIKFHEKPREKASAMLAREKKPHEAFTCLKTAFFSSHTKRAKSAIDD